MRKYKLVENTDKKKFTEEIERIVNNEYYYYPKIYYKPIAYKDENGDDVILYTAIVQYEVEGIMKGEDEEGCVL